MPMATENSADESFTHPAKTSAEVSRVTGDAYEHHQHLCLGHSNLRSQRGKRLECNGRPRPKDLGVVRGLESGWKSNWKR
jgi:hypothetical protein